MFSVEFFRTTAGSEIVANFLRALPKEDRYTVGSDLLTVQYGWPLGMPLCRALGGGLHEVRCSVPSKREIRLIFFVDEEKLVVVHGFVKKTQKTSLSDLQRARERKAEYERNKPEQ